MESFRKAATRFFGLPTETVDMAVAFLLGAIRKSGFGEEIAELGPQPPPPAEDPEPTLEALVPRLEAAGVPAERAGPFVSLFLNYLRQELGSETVAELLRAAPGLARVEARTIPGAETIH